MKAGIFPPKIQYVAEKVIFRRLLKNAPAYAEASAGRQMQGWRRDE